MSTRSCPCPRCKRPGTHSMEFGGTLLRCQHCGSQFALPWRATTWADLAVPMIGLAVVALFLLWLLAPTLKTSFRSDDWKAIQGTWRQTNQHQAWTFTFSDDTLTTSAGPRQLEMDEHTFRLDEKASPKQITWSDGKEDCLGIYELSGKRLRICFAFGERPTRFADPSDKNIFLYEFAKD